MPRIMIFDADKIENALRDFAQIAGTEFIEETEWYKSMTVPGWLSMATAPKSGDEIIVLYRERGTLMIRGAFYIGGCSEHGWWSRLDSLMMEKLDGERYPLGWMPKPEFHEISP